MPDSPNALPSEGEQLPTIDYYARLNLRQQRFVDAYITNGGIAAQAYLAAGYDAISPAQPASDLIRDNPNVSAAIAVKQAQLSALAALTREQYVADLKALASADAAEMFDPGTFDIRVLARWPLPLRQLIQGFERTKNVLKVRLTDRLKAMEMLGRALGYFERHEDSSRFELHINLSQTQSQTQSQEPQSHDYGALQVTMPSPPLSQQQRIEEGPGMTKEQPKSST